MSAFNSPHPFLTGGTGKAGGKSLEEIYGAQGCCQSPPSKGSTRSPRISTFQSPPLALPMTAGLWNPPDVHSKYPHFLIYFEVYRIVLHTLESRDHYPYFIGGEQRPEETCIKPR